MLTKNDDARNKWCPMGRLAGGLGNRAADGGPLDSRCLGEHCMFWRKRYDRLTNVPDYEPETIKDAQDQGYKRTAVRQNPNGAGVLYDFIRDTGYGYCGMAGKPE